MANTRDCVLYPSFEGFIPAKRRAPPGGRYVHLMNAAIRAYATLGVDFTASEAEVKRAYRAQLQRYHPDTGAGDVQALQSVRSAYRTLQAQYDGPYLSSARWADMKPAVGSLLDVYA